MKILEHKLKDRVHSVGVQLASLLTVLLCSAALAQNGNSADYTRSAGPPMFSYQELVALGEQEIIDPALAAKLHTLLTTPFVNNEAYFNGTKPLRPDLKGMGPSLRLVEWNIERGIELDKMKLLLTDKQASSTKCTPTPPAIPTPKKRRTMCCVPRWTCFSPPTC